jgi:hypothetical protein
LVSLPDLHTVQAVKGHRFATRIKFAHFAEISGGICNFAALSHFAAFNYYNLLHITHKCCTTFVAFLGCLQPRFELGWRCFPIRGSAHNGFDLASNAP